MTSKFLRPCLICGALGRGTRCDRHQAEWNSQRESKKNANPIRQAKKRELYGGDYRRRRAAVLATATHCHICREPLGAGDRVEADHLVPGDPNSPLAPAHRLCNQRRGDKPLP
jgi:hypothetical protein